jgi:hypothetical protein
MFTLRRRPVLAGLVLAAGLLSAGCSSSDSTGPGDNNGEYYFRFKANGTQVSFTTQSSLLATFAQAGSQYNGVFTGFDATTNAHVQVYDGAPISTKTYTGYNVVGTAFVGALIGWDDDTGTLYTAGSGDVRTVTITSLTDTYVQGTFSGTVSAAGKPSISITNGEFKLPRFN